MLTFVQSLIRGYDFVPHGKDHAIFMQRSAGGLNVIPPGYFSFKFGDNQEYELAFEPLLYHNQFYVALYKNGKLLTTKVPVMACQTNTNLDIDVTAPF